MNTPCLNPSQGGHYSIYVPRMDVRLSSSLCLLIVDYILRWFTCSMVPTTLQNSFSLTFPWLSMTKWIIFPDQSVHAKDQCWFSIACNHTRNNSGGTNSKVDIEIICERSEQKKIWSIVCSQIFFSVFLLTFAPWYFDFPWLSLTLRFSRLWNVKFPDFFWSSNFSLTSLTIGTMLLADS